MRRAVITGIGAVPEWNRPGAFLESHPKWRKRGEKNHPFVSRAVLLAAASVAEAFEDAGPGPHAMSRDELRSIGVIVGSGGGRRDLTSKPG